MPNSSTSAGTSEPITETLEQTVTIPAGCANSRLTLYLKIHTGEYGSTVYDTLTIRIGGAVLATYGNADAAGYTQRSFNVGAFAGQTVKISFTGAEDSSLRTSFVLDDLALTAS